MSRPQIETLFETAEIERAVAGLGANLAEQTAGGDPLFLGLLGGSVFFFADLVRAFGRPVRYELVHVGYHESGGGPGGGESPTDLLEIRYPIDVDLAGQDVVVVKDVVASGITETYFATQLAGRGAASVRFVALIDLPEERKTELAVDERAFVLHETGRLVGYGLKHEGRFGNLPYIGWFQSW